MSWTQYNVSQLPFVADLHTLVRNTGRQIDWAQIPETYREDSVTYTIKIDGGEAIGQTAIGVDPLPVALYPGDLLYFGQAEEFVRVAAYAAVGATSFTADALAVAIEDDDEATKVVAGRGAKHIPAGTVMCQLANGKIIPRVLGTGAIGLLETDAVEADPTRGEYAGMTGFAVIVGGVIYKNLLPDWVTADGEPWATYESELEAAGVATGWSWQTYADTRAS